VSDPAGEPSSELHADLYALVVYLHASCNGDLLDAIVHEQLSFGQLRLLERLRSGMRPTIGQAAKIMHVSAAAASRIVDGLARRDLVHRIEDDNDYRAKRIVITEKGEAAIARLHACRYDQITAFAGELDPDEREQVERTLELLLKREQIRAFRPLAPAA
jgi:DNA-binding MarR family transcriptional regulator